MITTLLLNVYKITNENIGDMRKKNPTDRFLESLLPTYCIRTDTHKIDYTASYLQFVGFFENEKKEEYWMFDIQGADSILYEEINQCGIGELLSDYDLSKIFEKISYNTYEDMGHSIPKTCHIFVELDYVSSFDYYSGGYEYDMDVYIRGYLSDDLKIIDIYNDEKNVVEETPKVS